MTSAKASMQTALRKNQVKASVPGPQKASMR